MGNRCCLADSCDGLALARCLLAACGRLRFACSWRSQLWFCVGHDAIILRLRPAEPAYIGWALVQPHELLLVDVGGDLFLSLSAAYARALASGAPAPPLPPCFPITIGASSAATLWSCTAVQLYSWQDNWLFCFVLCFLVPLS